MATPDLFLTCQHCGVGYHTAKSKAELKLTYCGLLCQLGGLGFTIEGILALERGPKVVIETPEPVEAAPIIVTTSYDGDDRELVPA